MSIRQNGKIIAGATQYHPDLFDWKWADSLRNDVQWLRADTFSWQSGAVYESAYQHLVDDIDGKTAQTETVAGITISFYLADDEHKICLASEESNAAAIYAATGMAWYYIIDTTNQRFKLPRAKHNKYATNLPVISNGRQPTYTPTDTSLVNKTLRESGTGEGSKMYLNPYNQGGDSALIVGNESGLIAPQEQEANQHKYLYFYIGSFTQTALENTAGLNAELFNGKVDVGHQVVEYQAPNAGNNYTWYRRYADGWIEQGGQATFSSNTNSATANLPVAMSNTNYQVFLTKGIDTGYGNAVYDPHVRTRGTTNFTYAYNTDYSGSYCFWVVYGIAA